MKTSVGYHGFALRHEAQISLLNAYLTRHYPSAGFYLLGITEQTVRTESLFTTISLSRSSVSHYYLLMVTARQTGKSLAALEDQVESAAKASFNLTVMGVYKEQFDRWLQQGHPFISAVIQRGLVLTGTVSGYSPAVPAAGSPNTPDLEKVCNTGWEMMHECCEGARMYRQRQQYALAAFMLHQSAEHGLRALLVATTGCRANTHNLDKLLRYCSMAVHKLGEIFKGSHASRALFQKLQSAYIHARYRDYHIERGELLALEKKLEELKKLYRKYTAPYLNCHQQESITMQQDESDATCSNSYSFS